MGSRKKTKPNPQAPAGSSSTGPDVPPEPTADAANTDSTTLPGSGISQDAPSNTSMTESTSTASSVATTAPSTPGTQTPKGKKWLSGSGSWRSKAPAIVKTAKESIGVTGGATGELAGEDAKKPRDDSPKKFLTKRKSSKGDAIPAAMTKVNVSSDGLVDEPQRDDPPNEAEEPSTPNVDEPPLPPEPPKAQTDATANTWAWRSWWSRPDGYAEANRVKNDAQSTPLPGPTPSEEPDAKVKGLESAAVVVASDQNYDAEMEDAPRAPAPVQDTEMGDAPGPTDKAPTRVTSSGSWFWSWSRAQNAQGSAHVAPPATQDTSALKPDQDSDATPKAISEAPPETLPSEASPEVTSTPAAAAQTTTSASTRPSAWAFWYTNKGKPDEAAKPADGGAQKHVGEVAVFDTPSQSHPEAAQFNEQAEPKPKQAITEEPQPKEQPSKEEPLAKRSFRSLRGRPKTKSTPNDTSTSSKTANPTKDSPVLGPTKPETAPAAQPAPKHVPKIKQEPSNLILPEFKTTYQLVQQPSFWQHVRQYFLGGEPATPHLHINPAPPRLKKAVAIGIHGFFPAPIIQKVLGQPTGTSIRFANAAAAAITDWSAARGYEPEIEQIALEGEGFVAERVNSLWKLLLNWIEHIKAADFILVACHSQGVPVAMMLVAKLIQFGCVNTTRIGVCAMAGVNMGPFIEYKTKYFGPTAAELFEFSNPKSLVSQMYLAALDEVLRFGVRVLYVGSIDDQLVSLESSTFSTLSHPYIYRAVFVDGRIHAPDFLTHLVGFTLKLRNLGLPDHGLIRELSPALAGSLYGGEGHSRVYEDPAVYALAVQHALETTSLPIPPQQRPGTSGSFQGINIPIIGEKATGNLREDVYKLRVKDYEQSANTANQNPFFLPWAMRGLLEEDFVKKELGKEVEDLLGMFEAWKPTGKQLKDVKFRLEGVRSKL
ncbi:uncharacterized protein K460DRAFT_275999 [Cucurbitaria berberidis CBS 394.84]|uniref:YMC020W-like alpha/beta hydrolase domain-containing protein n=1 Tax=Cucurbitaria berberidis CBS 394.84 TaxID=1168544 RepID=A0A9P4GQZ3_9PLEO|nr:uncharacterized protein K460DRAFT_275999 [Cucurbitaria berberidis CBS 394.84]KAF1849521.1 hypothetical protein K460DRAFT_275999 [Cucurbitaria berberidis CBS 394.84]